ncbi:TRAP transporter small permease [Halomonas sp. V046]|uniref:TRAP transporter small permease n=1 Tax=Halomonas sp. V046 TaxID=3459611 RepID=UPI004044E526
MSSSSHAHALIHRLSQLCLALAGLGAALLAGLVAYSVFMRWVMGAPPHWAEELPQLILVWTALLAAVACTHKRSHLNAGLMPLLVASATARRVITRVTDLVLLVMLIILAKAGWDLAWLTMSQTTTALQLPAGLVYLSVPVSCVAMALMQCDHLLTGENPS